MTQSVEAQLKSVVNIIYCSLHEIITLMKRSFCENITMITLVLTKNMSKTEINVQEIMYFFVQKCGLGKSLIFCIQSHSFPLSKKTLVSTKIATYTGMYYII